MSPEPLVMDEHVKAVIGTRGQVRTATDAVSTSEIRRFAQAIFDDNRIYYDGEAARQSRFVTRVGPGTFVLSSMRPNIPFTDDPLRRIGPREEASVHVEMRPLPKGWEGRYHFHAGDEVEFLRLPHEGDRVSAHPYVRDIYVKTGRTGTLAFHVTRTDYKDASGQLFASHDTHLVFPEESGERRRERAPRGPAVHEAPDPPVMSAPTPVDLARVNFEDVKIGDQAPTKLIRLTVPIIVRWAMATEAYRRDHYDYDFATQVGGHANIIASGLWALSCRWSYVSHFAGRDGWVSKISHQLRARMNVGDSLTATATVIGTERRENYGLVQLDVNFINQLGVVAVPGAATVALPYRGGPAVPYPFIG